jgi:hypothetical protein
MNQLDTVLLSPGGHFIVEKGYDPTVRVPQEVLKCVAFVGEVTHRGDNGEVYGDLNATGFLVSVRSRHFPELKYVYFVTAKHVADDLAAKQPYLLVNSKNGPPMRLTNFYPRWFFHPTDKKADVAIIQIAEHPDADHLAVSMDLFVTQADIASRQSVDIGDEVFVTGLFTLAPGQKRNLPIVRHGNVAMIPDEQIQTDLGFTDVYLVEGRSIGGLSGSPVFVRRTETFAVRMNDGRDTTMSSPGPFKLMGVMHGHWNIDPADINKIVFTHDPKGVNSGIAIVTPAFKIAEILEQPGMVEIRELSDEDLGRKRGHVPSTDSVKKDRPAFTQADFEAALKKASSRIEPVKS